ncbi:HNH endonuclease signature motif containing protein [Kribbella sp. NPDC050470]|uniref:HNH endonuclease signature motif containing protein n=1 Tax=unclassified Kribbella TaxID=2644121 RepID=UPI0037882E4E
MGVLPEEARHGRKGSPRPPHQESEEGGVTAERIARSIRVDPESGCWLWLDAVDTSGYGILRFRGAYWKAHRLSYSVHVGPIPDGLVIDHLCRVRRCVNPEHMVTVTSRENTRRGLSGVLRTHCKRGHEVTPENSYVRKDGSIFCRPCALESARRHYRKHHPEQPAKTHCPQGHEKTPENTRPYGDCRVCNRIRAREAYREKARKRRESAA